MRILHLIYDDPKNRWCGGGGAVRAFEINRRLAKGNEIKVITGSSPGLKDEIIEGVEYIRVGSSKNYLISRITYSLLAPLYMKKYDSDIIVNDFSVFSPVFCEFFTKRPVINILHHFVSKHAFRKYSIFGVIPYVSEKIILKISKYFLTVSPSNAKILEKERRRNEKIKYIYNGISDDLFCLESLNGDYIAFLGRIDIYMKGLDILLEAFSKIDNKNIRLKLAGIGKKREIDILTRKIEELELVERVSFLGSISEEEKKRYLSSSLFVVMPSRFEGWGIVAIEAQACGKAVIGAKIPGLQDAIKENETGILVEPENTNELKNAMMRLINNKSERKNLGEKGREWAQNFKWDNVAEEQMDFYKSILKNDN